MSKSIFIYILSDASRSTLYIGVTNNIQRRIIEHEENKGGFANRYKCFDLIYYEVFSNPKDAIDREKELKKWNRRKKEDLIKTKNPKFLDLSPELYAD
ncbi:MAG: GIY-YIG nuclease family protein [Crocinitomicaceae bacterium]|nr:GIY-YIG nuclease family protein [Crocinitomicaceae bacterium]